MIGFSGLATPASQQLASASAYQLQNQAMGSAFSPPVMWEENVPEDELQFEGICSRWAPYALYPRGRLHDINCCQRMLVM